MGEPDTLSCQSDHGDGSGDNDNMVLLKPETFVIAALSGLTVDGEESQILKDIRFAMRNDSDSLEETVARAVKELRKSGQRSLWTAEWNEQQGLLYFRSRLYVPPSHDLWCRIVEQHHGSRVDGHPGRFKTLELVSRNYWWPQMSRYIGQYTRHCDTCLRTKTRRRPPTGELIPTDTPTNRWEKISVDFIVELPEAHGFDAVMVVVDRLSKRAHFTATHTTLDASGSARLFLREMWKHHGLPRDVISDRGPQFVADFTRQLYQLLGIKISASTAYHPQSDGQTERVNQELEGYLRNFINERQDDWDELLPMGEFTYNNHIHSSTQETPFMLDTGRHPRMGLEPHQPPSVLESVNAFKEQMKIGLDEAKAAIKKAKDKYACYYNRRRTPAPTFQKGDRVWLDSSDIKTTRPSKKLDHKWWGPYTVEKAVGPGAYRLKLPHSMRRLHPVFPVVKLELAQPDPITSRIPPPPPAPVVIDDHEEEEVEEIVNSRIWRRKLQYKVRWKGYGPEDDTWEPVDHLTHAPAALAEFHLRHPGAPRAIAFASFDGLGFRRRE